MALGSIGLGFIQDGLALEVSVASNAALDDVPFVFLSGPAWSRRFIMGIS